MLQKLNIGIDSLCLMTEKENSEISWHRDALHEIFAGFFRISDLGQINRTFPVTQKSAVRANTVVEA
jgi:hypothetical protein